MLKIMLRFILLVFCIPVVYAQNGGEKVSIQDKGISLKEAFSLIEQQTGYSVAYEQSVLSTDMKVALSIRNMDVEGALDLILSDTPYSYKINGYHIIIIPTPDRKEILTQSIRGIVTDAKTDMPVEHASVGIPGNPLLASSTDSLGRFIIRGVPVGRYDVHVSSMGYHSDVAKGISVTSSKEVFLKISLHENVYHLDEVTVRPEIRKYEMVNPMVITGGRMISMEEAGRYANGFDDPARLSTAFAGVAGDVGMNAIAVRGNSPQYTQWRVEGVEIPNPSHFADISGLGGGFLSALSTQVIGNSDFYNGAFSAEYTNALSGIFDLHMRNGNNQKYEHTLQVGLWGIDVASEGPVGRKNGSSYIFNYRFSANNLNLGHDFRLDYQDLSFKLNFPTKRAGTFAVWGLGLIDGNRYHAKEKDEWETSSDRMSAKNVQGKFTGGLTHKFVVSEKAFLHSTLSVIYAHDRILTDLHTSKDEQLRAEEIRNGNRNMVFNTYMNTRISRKHTNRSGFTVTALGYDLDYMASPNFGLNAPMERVAKGQGESLAISAFSTSLIELNRSLTASAGITGQYFALNGKYSLEPRAALKWSPGLGQSIALAYGLHSRRDRLDYYFVEKEVDGVMRSNKHLDFSKAHHFVFTYNRMINPHLHLKIEPYYQYLFHIPVEDNTFFSVINNNDLYLDRILVSKGAGRNYGIDMTLERYMKNGFYYMVTGSLFRSKYRGGDHVWRNTRFDKGFLLNVLAGKEWMAGRRKQNQFSINGRLFFHGGDRYLPVDEEKTIENHDVVFDETNAFSKKFNPSLNGDFSAGYKINRRKVSHEFSIGMLNVARRTGLYYTDYNEKTNGIERNKESAVMYNFNYRICF